MAAVSRCSRLLDNDIGKVLRLRDDGGIPDDNPFVSGQGSPEIFTYGQRNVSDFSWHPNTGELWTTEIAPMIPWQGHLFVGALNGQTLVRVAFDQPMPQAERCDSLFISLGRRWRHVVQSPDGYLHALTEKRTLGGTRDPGDATSGVVYRIEPAE